MKNVFKAVIEKGDFDLTSMIATIDKFCIEGKITDEERHELYALARKSPKAQYNYDTEIEKLWEAIRALQSDKEIEGNTSTTPDEFKQPEGAHDAYMKGATVIYNGKTYKSLIDNNNWSPDTYPNGWEVIE